MIIDASGLLSTKNITKADLLFFFNQVAKFKIPSKAELLSDRLPPKGVLAFFEPSTRTKISFQSAGLDLGVKWIDLDPNSLSLKKGESLQDTFETINGYEPDFYVVRHSCTGVCDFVNRWTHKPVISAGDGMNEHPTQGLLDAYTLWSLNHSKKYKVAFFGDVARSRVARSSLDLFKKLGHSVLVVDDAQEVTRLFASAFKIKLIKRSNLKTMDVVYALRVQRERGSSNHSGPLSKTDLGPKTLWMHPGPKIMGEDLAADLCDTTDPRSLIARQSRNGFLVRRVLMKNLIDLLKQPTRRRT